MDITEIKSEFPIFTKYPDLVYLDNAATTQRPKVVIDALTDFHTTGNANIHRGVYDLSSRATRAYENAREVVAKFINAPSSNTVAFTQGTTESINMIASSFLKNRLGKGDNVIITVMEHHANFIPWQMVCKDTGAELRTVPVSDSGDIDLDKLENLIDQNTKLLAVAHISNTIGTINDLDTIVNLAHEKKSLVLIDAAQSAALYQLDVHTLDCDFLTFSGHKAFGPFGIGMLYVKKELIEYIHPYNFGGGIVKMVSEENTDFMSFPTCLEAGTPNISGAIGMAAGLNFIMSLDLSQLNKHIQEITHLCRSELNKLDPVQVIGNPIEHSGIVSFVIDDIHPHDIATFLNEDHIAVRAGLHCTQPLLTHLEVPATVRASFSIYNTQQDVERLIQSVQELIKFWK